MNHAKWPKGILLKHALRPIPPLAWIPLAILWLGLGDAAKIMVICFAAFVPAVINTYAGVRAMDRPVIEAARMLGTPPLRLVTDVIVPASSPMIFTGLRLPLQASWTTLVATELVGALLGLGFVLNMAQQDIYLAMILLGMAAVGLFGWATTRLLGVLERRAGTVLGLLRGGDSLTVLPVFSVVSAIEAGDLAILLFPLDTSEILLGTIAHDTLGHEPLIGQFRRHVARMLDELERKARRYLT